MCDDTTDRDAERWLLGRPMTRRQVTGIGAGLAASLLLPTLAGARDVAESEVTVTTPDGQADCYFVHPDSGACPAVVMWPDIRGLRPAFRQMGKRLAQSGYAVLVVNPFYRSAPAPVVPEGSEYSDPDTRATLRGMAKLLTPQAVLTDGAAFVQWLAASPAVDAGRKMGTTGYCMSGSFTLRMAAAMPDRIGAIGSFHGGRLATDQDDSPHLLAPEIRAGVLIAIAENDDERDPQAKVRLLEAFNAAEVEAEIEVYEDAMHGWCPPDSRAHNPAQAERAWSRLLDLLERKLV